MTINEKIEIFFKQMIAAMSNDMQTSQSEKQIVSIYLLVIDMLGNICSAKIPDQPIDGELEFIKMNERAADRLWLIFKENLERVGSELIHDLRFDMLNPANGFRDGGISRSKMLYVIQPPNMVQ